MKRKPTVLPSYASALILVLATGSATIAPANTIFTQDFEAGLGTDETVFGFFSINNTLASLNNGTMMMGHSVPYGPLGSGQTPLPSYSYYELVLDLRGYANAELRFDFSGGIEKDFDGFNLLATIEPVISPPNGLIMPTAGSAFQYDADLLIQHGESSPELGATAWSSPADPSVVVKDLAAIFDLSAFDGEKVIIRFQFGTDSLEGGEGANFDNIVVTGTPTRSFAVESVGDDLLFTWDSALGELFNLRSQSDPSAGDPATWPVFGGHQDIVATPPLNSLTIPRPADAKRFFTIEGFPPPPLLSEDFEAGTGVPAGWTAMDNGAGTAWEVNDPSTGPIEGPDAAARGANCAGTNITANYTAGADATLTTPAIAIPAGGARLRFRQYIDTDLSGDIGSVRLLNADNADAEIVDGDFPVTPIEGIEDGWSARSFALPAAALGKNIKVQFQLVSDGDTDVYSGFYVDDVVVDN